MLLGSASSKPQFIPVQLIESIMKRQFLMAAFLALFSAVGCKKDKVNSTPKAAVAYVNFFQAYPFARATNVYINSALMTSSAFLYTDSTGYRDVPAGQPTITYQSAESYYNYIDHLAITLQKDSSYSLFLCPNTLKNDTLLLQNNLKAPSAGKVKIRFLQTYSEPQIYSWAQPLSSILIGQDTVFKKIGYRTHTVYKEVSPGDYNIQVGLNGQTSFLAGSTTLIYQNTTAAIKLIAGHIYTVWGYSKVQPDSTYMQGLKLITDK